LQLIASDLEVDRLLRRELSLGIDESAIGAIQFYGRPYRHESGHDIARLGQAAHIGESRSASA
jgi:hypothetical protein